MNQAVDRQFLVWRVRAEAAELLLRKIIERNDEFRASLPGDWEGDPLNDVCNDARQYLQQLTNCHRPQGHHQGEG